MSTPTRKETDEFLKWLLGWHGDVPTCMIMTAPTGRMDFFLWKRSRMTNEVMLRQLDMFAQIETAYER